MAATELSGEVNAILSVGVGGPARADRGGAIVLAELAQRGGRVFHATEESLLAEFPTVADAMDCGTRIQARLVGSGLAVPPIGLACEASGEAVPRAGMEAAEQLRRQAEPGELRVSPTLAGGITLTHRSGQATDGSRSRRYLIGAAGLQLAILLVYFLSWYGLITWKAVNLARYGTFCWPEWLCDKQTPRLQPRMRPGEVYVPKVPAAK